MAQVLGIGGVFFKSNDPKGLGEWYRQWLGVPVEHPWGASFQPQVLPPGALGVWNPFDASTTYFQPSSKEFMFNLIVDDVDGALAQVVEGGAEVVGEIEESEFGRFGWFVDPEGNKVELWQPPEPTK
jgi:predicted enzyme related to lactoylglutathione lyase